MSLLHNRRFMTIAIFFLYLIPIVLLTWYVTHFLPKTIHWSFFLLGLLIAAKGAVVFFTLLYAWEKGWVSQSLSKIAQSPGEAPSHHLTQKITSLDSFASQDLYAEELKKKIRELEQQLQQAHDVYARQTQELAQELAVTKQREETLVQESKNYKLLSEEALRQRALEVQTLQKLSTEQRSEMEKRQEQIQLLDAKVHDLSYEIKTLLQLHPAETPPPITPAAEISVHRQIEETEHKENHPGLILLQRCLQTAQKIHGTHHYSTDNGRQRETTNSSAIDQRRLFDGLRSYTSGLIFVYSRKEDRPLFVNSACRTILGWSGEKFLADFSEIVQDGWLEWLRHATQLEAGQPISNNVFVKAKNGSEVLLKCFSSLIPSGAFKNYVICVCHPP